MRVLRGPEVRGRKPRLALAVVAASRALGILTRTAAVEATTRLRFRSVRD